MKKLLLLISLSFLTSASFGQSIWELYFENDFYPNRVQINPGNTWQIGHPAKSIFNAAYSTPNVIVTDTINPYPVNDSSSFTIIHIADAGWNIDFLITVEGWYRANTDSLLDYAYLEFSPDNGITWNRADSSENNGCTVGMILQTLPTFTGNSNGWQFFRYCLCSNVHVPFGDTVLYRFTFISDNIQTNKDGIMFDNLSFRDYMEAIDEYQNDNLISISPNPASDVLTIQRKQSSEKQGIQVRNSAGQLVYENTDLKDETIDLRKFENGVYFLKFKEGKSFAMKRFIVAH